MIHGMRCEGERSRPLLEAMIPTGSRLPLSSTREYVVRSSASVSRPVVLLAPWQSDRILSFALLKKCC